MSVTSGDTEFIGSSERIVTGAETKVTQKLEKADDYNKYKG